MSRPNTDGESNLGTHSQSIEPSRVVKAAEWQSDNSACSAIGVELIGNGKGVGQLVPGAGRAG